MVVHLNQFISIIKLNYSSSLLYIGIGRPYGDPLNLFGFVFFFLSRLGGGSSGGHKVILLTLLL